MAGTSTVEPWHHKKSPLFFIADSSSNWHVWWMARESQHCALEQHHSPRLHSELTQASSYPRGVLLIQQVPRVPSPQRKPAK